MKMASDSEPPQEKVKKDDARSKTYQQSRLRSFEESQKISERGEERKWLHFDSDRNLMI